MVRPSMARVEMRHLADDRPGEDVEEVRYKRLIQIPARAGGEKNACQLGRGGVENVAPLRMSEVIRRLSKLDK